MANYLAGITNLASSISAGLSGRSSSGAISGGIQSVLSTFGGLGAGSKPGALHTEYASGEANWIKPYASGTDIVFYLVRADRGANGAAKNTVGAGELSGGIFSLDGSQSVVGNETFTPGLKLNTTEGFEAVGPTFGAAAITGAGLPKDLQSPLNQVATYGKMDMLYPMEGVGKGLAGPLTGFGVEDQTQLGKLSQTFSKLSSTVSSIKNVTQSVPSLQSLRLSNASSETFFSDVLTKSFAPDSPLSGVVKTAADIRKSISNGSISDLSTMLSTASNGVTTAKQLIEGINKGEIGFTTQGSGAEASRLGPEGYSRERLRK